MQKWCKFTRCSTLSCSSFKPLNSKVLITIPGSISCNSPCLVVLRPPEYPMNGHFSIPNTHTDLSELSCLVNELHSCLCPRGLLDLITFSTNVSWHTFAHTLSQACACCSWLSSVFYRKWTGLRSNSAGDTGGVLWLNSPMQFISFSTDVQEINLDTKEPEDSESLGDSTNQPSGWTRVHIWQKSSILLEWCFYADYHLCADGVCFYLIGVHMLHFSLIFFWHVLFCPPGLVCGIYRSQYSQGSG